MMTDLQPGTHVEKYEIISEMGAGGMARVFKVRHSMLGSLHALKVLDANFVRDAEVRQRFLSEGQIQARLIHQNIARVTDIIALPGVAGLVVEYVEGLPLDEYIEEFDHAPTINDTKEMFLPLLAALGFAHKNGIVHRDIKPSNIIVAGERGTDLCPKILDFGIAKIAEAALGEDQSAAKRRTRTGARMGTLYYMSPEQVKGAGSVDHRADVYSMAATLYEFATREVPFEGDSEYDTMRRIVEDVPVPPRKLVPGLDPVIEACIIKGLAKDPAHRFQSCEEFAGLLENSGTGTGQRRAQQIHQELPAIERANVVARHATPPPLPVRRDTPPPAEAFVTRPRHEPMARDANLIYPKAKPDSPIAVALLSVCCLSGIGHLVIGQVAKGALIFAGSFVLGMVTGSISLWITWPLAAIDSYLLAKKLKDGKPIEKWEWF